MPLCTLPYDVRLTIDADVITQRDLITSAGINTGVFGLGQRLERVGECNLSTLSPGNLGFYDAVASMRIITLMGILLSTIVYIDRLQSSTLIIRGARLCSERQLPSPFWPASQII